METIKEHRTRKAEANKMKDYSTETNPTEEQITKYNTNDNWSSTISKNLDRSPARNLLDFKTPYIVSKTIEFKQESKLETTTTRDIRRESYSSTLELGKHNFYSERSRYSFEPEPLDTTIELKHKKSSIEKTLDYWIESTKLTLALPVVSAAGLDLISRNFKLTLTRKVLGTYGKAIKWTASTSKKVVNKTKSLSKKS